MAVAAAAAAAAAAVADAVAAAERSLSRVLECGRPVEPPIRSVRSGDTEAVIRILIAGLGVTRAVWFSAAVSRDNRLDKHWLGSQI